MQNNSNVENEEIEIQLLPLLKALLENLKLIIVIVILFAAGAFLITKFFVTPTYRTNFAVYVNNRNETEKQTAVTSSDITAAKSLAKTYAEIIKSRYVLTEAGKDAGLDYSYKKLAGMVLTETSGDTEIISVYVVSSDPKEAMQLAKCIAKISQSRIAQIIEGCSMAIVDEAYYPTDIYTPSYVKNTAIGGIVGFLLITAIIVLFTLLDTRIKTEEDLENRLGMSVLGVIPNFESAEKVSGYGYGRKRGNNNG